MSTAANGEDDATSVLLNANTVMQPFLDILRDGSSSNMNLSTVRSLAVKTFAHPLIFSGFDEFKSHCSPLLLPQGETNPPSSGSHNSSLYHTLDLFSYGTLEHYKKNQQKDTEYYLPLNEQALAKLGQLTVLSCIQEACLNGETSISYDVLARALDVTENIRAVEDVLIRCLYANVLKGKLCQKTRTFGWRGESLPVVSSRDVPPSHISNLLSALRGLGQRLEENVKDVALAQDQVTQEIAGTTNHWKSVQLQRKKLLEDSLSRGGGNRSGGDGASSLASRIFEGGRQGGFIGSGSSDASAGNLRRSSKRSRGGLAGKFVTDASGYRM